MSSPRIVMLAALLCTLLSALLWATTVKPPMVFNGDTPGFLKPAYNLLAYQTFSAGSDARPDPGGAREPGYPWLLTALMYVDADFGSFTNDCLNEARPCADDVYRIAQQANGVLVALAGLAVFLAAWHLTGRTRPAFLAGALIWLNGELAKGRHDLMSDYLALFFMALTMYGAAWAATGGRPGDGRSGGWIIVGGSLALLALTKAIYLYFFLAAAALALLGLLAFRSIRRPLLIGLLSVSLGFGLLAGSWMARNAVTTGQFAIATDDRAGVALSARHEYNRMTPTQYAAAFVHWTRGFGDNLARSLFGEEIMADFGYDNPEGFVYRGHLYGQRVRETMAREAVSLEAAQAAHDRELTLSILRTLPVHLLTTLPLLYRGLWIDEFIVLTFPALIWLSWTSWRQRRWSVLILLSGGWFTLLFYPLVSLNIPRYQITAVPALALAGGIAAAALYEAIRAGFAARRRSS